MSDLELLRDTIDALDCGVTREEIRADLEIKANRLEREQDSA